MFKDCGIIKTSQTGNAGSTMQWPEFGTGLCFSDQFQMGKQVIFAILFDDTEITHFRFIG